MIRIILSAILLLILPIQVWSEDDVFRGSFTCKVKYQKIIVIDEAIVEEYNGIKDGVKVGDSFELKYRYHSINNGPDKGLGVFAFLGTEIGVLDLVPNIVNPIDKFAERAAFFGYSYSPRIYPTNSVMELDFFYFKSEITFVSEHLFLTEDNLDLHTRYYKLEMKRYYKNDWSVLYNSKYDENNFITVMGFDCRHNVNKFDEIFADLESKGLRLKK